MPEADKLSARYEDLILTIIRHGAHWRVRVQELDDQGSGLSDGIDYPSVETAQEGAISVASELFGTGVSAKELAWRPMEDSF